ncbi:MAG: citrate synthase [Leptolyngbya sp.]|nr:citrate synthase [Candidatus Melainabacteria bacterium]
MTDEEKLLSGSQAAEFLGVKSATLYAYASRGMIESQPGENARERSYRMSDLIRLRQASRGFKSPKEQEAAVWTGPVIKSAITEIREDGHRYRGQSAIDLARADKPFEEVVDLLWEAGGNPVQWKRIKPLPLPKELKLLASRDADFLDLLKLMLVTAEMDDPVSRKLLSSDVFDTARRLIVTMAMVVGLPNKRDKFIADGPFPIAQTLLAALSGNKSKEKAQAINSALVLCADHELNASALAARIAASCDASLYSCVESALGAFSGSMHGSASRRAEDIVTTSLKFKTATAWLKDYLRQFESLPGFGTDLYEEGDPRAKILISAAQAVSSKNTHLKRLLEIVDCVRDQLGLEPNLDVGLAAISYALALPAGAGSTIFAVSRSSGWIAHAIEQRMYGGVIRPRARYIGKSS